MSETTSNSSRISSTSMRNILNRLKYQTTRDSTAHTYLNIWRQFNNFLVKLDKKPNTWEDRISLFAAYLIDTGIQSSTLKSYYSAIKGVLMSDDYLVNDSKVILTSLVKACRLVNDNVKTRLPINSRL